MGPEGLPPPHPTSNPLRPRDDKEIGGLLTTSPTSGGIPLDVFLRLRLGRVYLEGVGGPWIFFTGDALRGHAAVGLGLFTQDLEFGAEFGFLSPDRTQLGVRLGFRI